MTVEFPRMPALVAPAAVGVATVEHFTVDRHLSTLTRLASAFGGDRYAYCPPGRYARLEVNAPKGQKWDTIYFDIWPDVCIDNLEGAARLARKFSPRLDGWVARRRAPRSA